MANYQLNAQLRNVTGKSEVKRLRSEALIPANVYGRGKENVVITILEKDLEKVLSSGANLIDLSIGDSVKPVLVKEVQKNPIKGSLYHVDFYEVSMDRAIETTVTIHLVGDEERVADGGIVNQMLRELSLSCLPNAIPDSFEVDIANLKIGEGVLVSDLTIPEGVTVLNDLDDMVVRVALPTVEAEPEEDEEDVEGVEGEEGQETDDESTPSDDAE